MKKYLAILLIGVMLISTAACSKPVENEGTPLPEQPIEETEAQGTPVPEEEPKQESQAQIPNPINTVESADAFTNLNVYMDVPEDAENVTYSVISNEVAQIDFTYNGHSYVYRGSQLCKGQALHGIYETFDVVFRAIDVDEGNWYVSASVQTVNEGKNGSLAQWRYNFVADVDYTLWTADEVTYEEMAEIVTKLGDIACPRTVGDSMG